MFLYFRHEPINAPVTTNNSLVKNADTQAKFELVFPFELKKTQIRIRNVQSSPSSSEYGDP